MNPSFLSPRSGKSLQPPKVSVILMVQNPAPRSNAAIQSIRAQTLTNWELIVIESAFDDNTSGTIASCVNGDERIRVLAVKELPAVARRYGLLSARGQYLYCLDANHLSLPDALQRLCNCLDIQPDAAVAYGIVGRLESDGSPLDLLKQLATEEFLDTGAVVIRRSALDAALADSHVAFDDSSLWWSLLSNGPAVLVEDKAFSIANPWRRAPAALSNAEKNRTPGKPAYDLIQGLWIGPRLSTMEQLSIASFLYHGHPYHLYTYGPVEGLPEGAELKNANTILPASSVFAVPKSAGYPGFSDFFRYKLLLEHGGWWADMDMICLRPFHFPSPFVFCTEMDERGGTIVNPAAMKVPPGNAVMEYAWKACQSTDLKTMQWAQCGPPLADAAVEACSMRDYMQPPHVFCPIPHLEWGKLLDPKAKWAFSETTVAVHCWNELWRRTRRSKDESYEAGCLYEELKRFYLEPRHAPQKAGLPIAYFGASNGADPAPYKLAYLIIAHQQPKHLGRLIRALDQEDSYFFIHIDAKADLPSFQAAVPQTDNVIFVADRVRVEWGKFTVVQATLNLIQSALASGHSFRYFTLLSGSDYPVKHRQAIREQLLKSNRQYLRIDRRLTDPGNTHARLLKDLPAGRYFGDMVPYHGSMHWSLTADCIRFISGFIDDNPGYVDVHRHVSTPDEVFFHTLVKHSPFAGAITHDFSAGYYPNHTHHGIHFIDWKGLRKRGFTRRDYLTLDERDFDDLLTSDALLARKFDECKSRKLLDLLDLYVHGCDFGQERIPDGDQLISM